MDSEEVLSVCLYCPLGFLQLFICNEVSTLQFGLQWSDFHTIFSSQHISIAEVIISYFLTLQVTNLEEKEGFFYKKLCDITIFIKFSMYSSVISERIVKQSESN